MNKHILRDIDATIAALMRAGYTREAACSTIASYVLARQAEAAQKEARSK